MESSQLGHSGSYIHIYYGFLTQVEPAIQGEESTWDSVVNQILILIKNLLKSQKFKYSQNALK